MIPSTDVFHKDDLLVWKSSDSEEQLNSTEAVFCQISSSSLRDYNLCNKMQVYCTSMTLPRKLVDSRQQVCAPHRWGWSASSPRPPPAHSGVEPRGAGTRSMLFHVGRWQGTVIMSPQAESPIITNGLSLFRHSQFLSHHHCTNPPTHPKSPTLIGTNLQSPGSVGAIGPASTCALSLTRDSTTSGGAGARPDAPQQRRRGAPHKNAPKRFAHSRRQRWGQSHVGPPSANSK